MLMYAYSLLRVSAALRRTVCVYLVVILAGTTIGLLNSSFLLGFTASIFSFITILLLRTLADLLYLSLPAHVHRQIHAEDHD